MRFIVICLAVGCFPLSTIAAELLPVEHFARLPRIGGPSDSTSIELSPDGSRYAAIISVQEEPALAAVPTDGSDDIKLTLYGEFQPLDFMWATDRHLLASFAFPSRRYGYETTERRLAVFDTVTGKLDRLIRHREAIPGKEDPTHFSQIQDRLVSRLPVDGDAVLVALDRDEPGLPGVYRFSLGGDSLGERVIRQRGGIQRWMQDASGVVRLGYGLRRNPAGYLRHEARLIFRATAEDDFSTHATFDPRDVEGDAFGVVGFTEQPGVLLIADLNDHGRRALFKLDMATSKVVETVFSHEKYDVASVDFAPGTDRLISVGYWADVWTVHYFDDEERQDQESLGRIYPGKQARVVSRDKSRNKLIVRVESPSSSPAYYYFDIAKNVYAPLGSAYPQLDGMTLSETRPIAYQARDGLRIDGYLTVPKGAEARRLPLIVHPHGGPAARDAMTYSYWVQYFASRGWAVLQMNFRGSEGYGDAFENAGRGQWGRAMQDDVTDGVRWAVAEGLADPDRICIVGASYGGYVALWGAASTPELYRCAVSLNGVSDIRAMINDARHYTNFMLTRDYLAHEDPDAVAPVRHADKVRVPVLVGYGTKDRSVGPDQSTAMIAALRRAGKPVAAVELEGGDHYLTHERHRVQFFQAMDAFLQEHLGLGPVPSAAVAADK